MATKGAGNPGHIRRCGVRAGQSRWVEQKRGRYYSPAWHAFVNADQGADPNSLNQRAYVGGRPMVSKDSTGRYIDMNGNGHRVMLNKDTGSQFIGEIYGRGGMQVRGDGTIDVINTNDYIPTSTDQTDSEPEAVSNVNIDMSAINTMDGASLTFTGPTLPDGTPILGYVCGGPASWPSNFSLGLGIEYEAGFGQTDTHGVATTAISLTNSGGQLLPNGLSVQATTSLSSPATVYGVDFSIGKTISFGNAGSAGSLSGPTTNTSVTLGIIQLTYGSSSDGGKQFSAGFAFGISLSRYITYSNSGKLWGK